MFYPLSVLEQGPFPPVSHSIDKSIAIWLSLRRTAGRSGIDSAARVPAFWRPLSQTRAKSLVWTAIGTTTPSASASVFQPFTLLARIGSPTRVRQGMGRFCEGHLLVGGVAGQPTARQLMNPAGPREERQSRPQHCRRVLALAVHGFPIGLCWVRRTGTWTV